MTPDISCSLSVYAPCTQAMYHRAGRCSIALPFGLTPSLVRCYRFPDLTIRPTAADPPPHTPLRRLVAYATGEGAYSLTVNGIGAFALLFYVQVLGLSGSLAGLALSVTMLWDAVTDPVMGHISDNTRSRFGRRHPYILGGGILLAMAFFCLWSVPGTVKGPAAIFWYLLAMNLVVKTASTIFGVPYIALGFEICTDYDERAKLQSVRYILNMTMNLVFNAGGWLLFFGDRRGALGRIIDGTTIEANYRRMGLVLSLAVLALILICYFSTKRHAYDTRHLPGIAGNNLRAFARDMKDILKDRLAVAVFAYFAIAQFGMLLVSQIQMFTYRFYMGFPDILKTIVHGSGMVGFALGSLVAAPLVRRWDKKPAAAAGVALNVAGSLLLYVFFIGGILAPQAALRLPEGLPLVGGMMFPLAAMVFAFGQTMYWGGNGVLAPLATSMIADVSELNKHRTGVLKDGSYSAVFSFFNKATTSLGLLVTGLMLDAAGIIPEASTQTAAAARNVARLTFVSGPVIALLALLVMLTYPVNRQYMANVRAGLAGALERGA
jgi:GPH family glycoside/pentoside/hexuronide:cation symporter